MAAEVWCLGPVVKLFSVQVELKEYVKLQDTIYEVDPKEEECFRFSRLLNFKVSSAFINWTASSDWVI